MLTSCLAATCTAQNDAKNMAEVDSVIRRTEYGIIYITCDTTAVAYDWLDVRSPASFEPENFDADYLREMEARTKTPMRHVKDIDLYPYWTSLHKYKSDYYVYSPSDWMWHATMYVTDTILFRLTIPDPTIRFITDFNRISDTDCEIGVVEDGVIRKIRIRKVETGREVYLWQFMDKDGRTVREAYKTPSNLVRNFKMIVNHCYDSKCYQEFDFEE